MNNKPFGKRPGKFYQSIFRHIRIQKPDRGRGSPGPTPKLLCRVQTPRGQRAQRQPSNTPSSNQRTPKPSAPTGEGGPPIGSAPRTSGRPHPRPPTGLSPRIPPSELTPLVSTPSMPTPGTTLQPGPGESKGGPQAKGKLGGGPRGAPPLPWWQAGARQRSHGCRGRGAPGSRLGWLPALFPLVTTRGPNASPR